MNELGRFKIIPASERRTMALPACSLFNRRDDEEFYIDTDYDLDPEGRIYIGKTDAEHIARLIGWLPPNNDIVSTYDEVLKENDNLRNLIANARDSATGLLSSLESSTLSEDGGPAHSAPRIQSKSGRQSSQRDNGPPDVSDVRSVL